MLAMWTQTMTNFEELQTFRETACKWVQLTPNNSLQRTYLPVTSFAFAKESPATVGR